MRILMGLSLILLGICTVTDVKRREIMVSLPLLFGLLSLLFRGMQGTWWLGFPELLLRFVPGAVLLGIHALKKDWLGAGDGLLVFVCGYMMGAKNIFRLVMIASLISGCVSAILLVTGRRGRKDTIPFVPYLLAGCVIVCILDYLERMVFT